MLKKKPDTGENKVPSPEELSTNTKNTLKSYIKLNTFLGVAAGLGAGMMVTSTLIEDSQKKMILGCSGALTTAVSVGSIAVSMKKMDDFIDNHDEASKLQIIGSFLNNLHAISEKENTNV